ncbi:hypothetical protein JXJ21_03240 [candidate division KSB1 bacterium]|nr:hypothetical protein [candidate division KSB1 bacterium]
MKEHPIIFNGEMVLAILDGSKKQTRRPVKPQPPFEFRWLGWTNPDPIDKERPKAMWVDDLSNWKRIHELKSPFGIPGDHLWIKEVWHQHPIDDFDDPGLICYKASTICIGSGINWRSSRFMPRWASRINLEIVNVRVERLQEISKQDAIDEGMYCGFIAGKYNFSIGACDAYTANYRASWDNIYAKRGYPWESNPWVWVIDFRRIE